MKKYTIKRADRAADTAEVGETVFECLKHDFGCSSEDSRGHGIPHISVTRDPEGDYPFFTIPEEDLEAQ